jgi:hypothetical protein
MRRVAALLAPVPVILSCQWLVGYEELHETPEAGLIGYWPLDETSGTTAFDQTAAQKHGTFSAVDSSWTSGKLNGALQFALDSSGVHMSGWDGPALPAAATLTFWFQLGTGSLASNPSVFDGYDDTRRHIFIRMQDNGILQCILQDRLDFVAGAEFSVVQGQWHFVAVGYDADANEGVCYLDGIYQLEAMSKLDWLPDEQVFCLGCGTASKIDEVRLFDRLLSKSELDTERAR